MVQRVWVFLLALLATVAFALRVPHHSSKNSHHAGKEFEEVCDDH